MKESVIEVGQRDRKRLRNLRFFTLGYQLIPAGDFVEKLVTAEVDTVVDVRERAWSRKPGFSKSQLEKALGDVGITYLHAEFAGNPRELRQNADHKTCLIRYSAHVEANPAILDEFTQLILGLPNPSGICFICYERHPDDCHRSILFDHWKNALDEDLSIEHLAPNGAPRFLKE